MISSFQELVEKIRIEAEKTIKAELSKRSWLERTGFKLFMPLTVNIVTDQGAACLTILGDGAVQLSEHLPSNPDTTIQARFEMLAHLYIERDKGQFTRAEEEGSIKITSHSAKGRQAERQLRELLTH